ncbi:DHH family phosphoesterase [Nitrosophilus kaiyonis]|uniref:DHH family phosphoesterase n=1 Tax=Nitrosophilus kaiyonis TaxID=2930200 RepID=UPI0024913487|nr:bifunctional oligoribonuclease/PAP phosphatase NrnA [Nitrosophilus kaiyonis]
MYKKAYELIKNASNIALISHINPDGDALGSSLAIYDILKKMNKKVSIVNVTKNLPYNLNFLPGFNKIKTDLPKKVDLLISFDCGSFDRLGIDRRDFKIINFDHHITNTKYGDINLIENDFAATGEVVYKFLKENGIKISKECAICIYTALVSDTGFFQYESVNERVFNIAAELVKLGVAPDFIAKMLNEREPLAKVRLTAKILDTLTLYLNAKVAVVFLTQEMLKKCGATVDMAENASNIARSLATVEVGILLREEEDGRIKVSLRSKNYVDVSKIAKMFEGGGHKRAAGFVSEYRDFNVVLDELLQILKKELN